MFSPTIVCVFLGKNTGQQDEEEEGYAPAYAKASAGKEQVSHEGEGEFFQHGTETTWSGI